MADKIITARWKLRIPSKPTTWDEVNELNLVKRLREANSNAWTNGCGLAAIQIGIPLRFAWFIHIGTEYTLMNPEITLGMGVAIMDEGCLSVPDQWKKVKRFWEIEYISDGKKHRAKRFKARIVQHEIGHMNGELYDEISVLQNK